ncbi:MAG: hypothetical protein HOQ26_08900 [Gemmatimonadaceae bacterium]|nr:hypothetical protein [Gemmatimonadaceae bacterium]
MAPPTLDMPVTERVDTLTTPLPSLGAAELAMRWRRDERSLDLASWKTGVFIRAGAAAGAGLALLLPPLMGVTPIAVARVVALLVAALGLNVWVYALSRRPDAYRRWYKYAIAAVDVALVTGAYTLCGSLAVMPLYMVPITTHAFHRGDALAYYVLALSAAGAFGGMYVAWGGHAPDTASLVWLIVGTGILVVTALLTVRMASDLRRRIRATRETLLLVERGDLTARAASGQGDELGLLEASLNSSLAEVGSLIGGVQREAVEVASFAEQLAAFSEQLTDKGRAFGEAATELARHLDGQRSSVERGAQRTEEALEAAQRLSERAAAMELNAQALIETGGRSRDAIGTAAENLLAVGQQVRESATAIEGLVDAATRISSFAETVSVIARNTNLLALNAAIEAARAGEHGKGFAVVADEVRKLAEGSARAAREIAETMKSLRDRAGTASRVMGENEGRVLGVGEVATEATAALGGVLDGSRRLADVVGEAATVSRSQSHAMAELSAVIAEVRSVASDAASRAGAAAGVAHEQHAALDSLAETAQELARLAERLRASSGSFRVGQAASSL